VTERELERRAQRCLAVLRHVEEVILGRVASCGVGDTVMTVRAGRGASRRTLESRHQVGARCRDDRGGSAAGRGSGRQPRRQQRVR
jgi:hypothetical protein